MDQKEIEYFIEAALLAAGRPLNIDTLQGLFDGRSTPEKSVIRAAIKSLNEEYEPRGIEIADVASGFRMQVKETMAERLGKLWEERPPRYSRALFETLALIAYRQPITRGEIEEVRGVSVSSNIMRSLMERDWVRVVGHRDVPGRPAMYGTTKSFLDYFSLKKLDDLPELADLSDWESLRVQLDLPAVDGEEASAPEVEGDVVALENADDVEGIPELEPEADDAVEASTGDIPELQPEAENDAEADAEAGNDEEASAADNDESAVDVVAEAAEAADELPELEPESAEADLPELAVEEPEEELVVSEWPSPDDAASVASLSIEDDSSNDRDNG